MNHTLIQFKNQKIEKKYVIYEFWKHFSKKQYVSNNISAEEFNDYFTQLFNEMPNVYNDKAEHFVMNMILMWMIVYLRN